MNLDFDIPRQHCSIITPEGYILLFGGLIPQNNNESLEIKNNCYILDLEGATLIEIESMNLKRGAMSCIYTSFGILVVGGVLDNYQTTTSCELYDIDKNRWSEVAQLSEPVMKASLTLINQ